MTHASSETDDRTSRIESPSSASRAVPESIHLESIHLDTPPRRLSPATRVRVPRAFALDALSRIDRPRVRPRLRVVSTARPGLWRCTFGLVVPSASASSSRPSSTSVVDVARRGDVDVVSSVRPGDVLRFTLVDDNDADDGRDDDTRAHKGLRFLEVTATTATTAIGRCRGRRCALEISANETFVTRNRRRRRQRTSRCAARSGWMTLLEALATRERYPRGRETGARRCEDVVRVKV